MAISIDWITGIITVPRNDMTLVSVTPHEVRGLDVDGFRLTMRDLEDDPDGRPWPRTHNHDTETLLSGVVYARKVEFLAPYTITFEDGQYEVRLEGANNNVLDVANLNQVSIRPNNSAGLQTVASGSGLDAAQDAALTRIDTNVGYQIKIIDNQKILIKEASTWYLRNFDDNGTTVIRNKALKDEAGNDISDVAAGAIAQELKSDA